MSNVTEALLDKLRELFGKHKDLNSIGGCRTCGYGSVSAMTDSAFEDLLTEIDEWAQEQFGKPDQPKE